MVGRQRRSFFVGTNTLQREIQQKYTPEKVKMAAKLNSSSTPISTPSSTMGGIFSKEISTTGYSKDGIESFDGLGLTPRPKGLPQPTIHSRAKLSQLLRANHLFYATLFNNRKFHNHTPHALISAYFLGATPEMLTRIYEEVSEDSAKWEEDSPAEVTDDDWFEFIGNKDYERGFHNFFHEKITEGSTFNWQAVVQEFLVKPDPHVAKLMMEGLVGGLLHPLIHLGYATEFDDWEVATEALTLCAVSRTDRNLGMLKLIPYGEKPADKGKRALDILESVRNDTTFDGRFVTPSKGVTAKLVAEFPEVLSEYINQFTIGNTHDELIANLKELLATSALLTVASNKDETELPVYDFFIIHLFTATHAAIEIIDTPPSNRSKKALLPVELEYVVVQSLWTSFVLLYIIQTRPSVKVERVTHTANADFVPSPADNFSATGDINDAAWANIYEMLFSADAPKHEAHVLKVVRGLLFARAYLDKHDFDLPETSTAGLEFFTQAAYTFTYSMRRNPTLVGRPSSTQTLDIKP